MPSVLNSVQKSSYKNPSKVLDYRAMSVQPEAIHRQMSQLSSACDAAISPLNDFIRCIRQSLLPPTRDIEDAYRRTQAALHLAARTVCETMRTAGSPRRRPRRGPLYSHSSVSFLEDVWHNKDTNNTIVEGQSFIVLFLLCSI